MRDCDHRYLPKRSKSNQRFTAPMGNLSKVEDQYVGDKFCTPPCKISV